MTGAVDVSNEQLLVEMDEPSRLEALHRYEILGSGPEQVYDDLTKLAARILHIPFAGISLVNEKQQWFKSCYGWSLGSLDRSKAFCSHAILNPLEALVVRDVLLDPRFASIPLTANGNRIRSYAGAPLITPDFQVIGTLCVMDTEPRDFSIEEIETLRMLARQAISQLELRRQTVLLSNANDKLRTLASCDGLTGLHNVRAFHEQLTHEIQFAARNRSALSLVLMDIDQFKEYNDAYGHPAGDLVLQAVAILLLESSRDYDFVARYGGEEFAVILRGADASEAFAVAERLRSKIAGAAWPLRRITASLGVSTFSVRVNTHDKMVAEADELLYRSKMTGRNRVSQRDPDDLFDPAAWESVHFVRHESRSATGNLRHHIMQ